MIRQLEAALILIIVAWSIGCSVKRDMADAKAVAGRIHSQMKAGDYFSIYRESATRFQSVGSEAQSISLMQQFSQENGAIREAKDVAYQTGVDSGIGRNHVLLYDVTYEHGRARERMILTHDKGGQMQLWKLDMEPIK
jgi:hypothetical protein